ncbi:MAG: hypothetical protein JSU59_07795 [Nitrospirota bacterium]|nr:MAG: hypothetical protein JSU59_07795 [Nitrospirota bacterium]
MTEREKHLEQFRDLTWFIELLNQGFAHLAQVGGYTDAQFRALKRAIFEFEPMPDELGGLLAALGVLIVQA